MKLPRLAGTVWPVQDGACAVTAFVLDELVLVANVGDAKCVLARRPAPVQVRTAGGGGTSRCRLHSAGRLMCISRPHQKANSKCGQGRGQVGRANVGPASQREGAEPSCLYMHPDVNALAHSIKADVCTPALGPHPLRQQGAAGALLTLQQEK